MQPNTVDVLERSLTTSLELATKLANPPIRLIKQRQRGRT